MRIVKSYTRWSRTPYTAHRSPLHSTYTWHFIRIDFMLMLMLLVMLILRKPDCGSFRAQKHLECRLLLFRSFGFIFGAILCQSRLYYVIFVSRLYFYFYFFVNWGNRRIGFSVQMKWNCKLTTNKAAQINKKVNTYFTQ